VHGGLTYELLGVSTPRSIGEGGSKGLVLDIVDEVSRLVCPLGFHKEEYSCTSIVLSSSSPTRVTSERRERSWVVARRTCI